jgi:hypothetical protein
MVIFLPPVFGYRVRFRDGAYRLLDNSDICHGEE